jgi:hypothetical protein
MITRSHVSGCIPKSIVAQCASSKKKQAKQCTASLPSQERANAVSDSHFRLKKVDILFDTGLTAHSLSSAATASCASCSPRAGSAAFASVSSRSVSTCSAARSSLQFPYPQLLHLLLHVIKKISSLSDTKRVRGAHVHVVRARGAPLQRTHARTSETSPKQHYSLEELSSPDPHSSSANPEPALTVSNAPSTPDRPSTCTR